MITTRMRDTAFKRVLKTLALGTTVTIEVRSPTWRSQQFARAAVILSGGIGITPFRSILVHAARQKLPHHIFVFYSNRRPEDAAFLDELVALQQTNSNYKLVATMTDMASSHRPWTGETGLID